MQFLVEILLELVLQVVFEFLAESGLRRTRVLFRRPKSPILAGLGYALLGAAGGGISLVPFPALFLASSTTRVANLVLTPVAAGFVMVAVGAWRRRRGQPLLRIDRFAYGYVFAIAMAAVRFAFGR